MRAFPFNLDDVVEASKNLPPAKAADISGRYHLGLGITNRCNFDCPFCYYHGSSDRDTPEDMPVKYLQEVLGGLPLLAGIIIGLEGEPLLHPHFLEVIKEAAGHARNIVLITNGSLITEAVCKALEDLPSCQIFLSIDASDADLYHQLRAGGSFENFKKNARRLAQTVPCLLHATVFRQNLASLTKLPQLAKVLGINHVSFQQLRQHPGSIDRGITKAAMKLLESWLEEVAENAEQYGIEITLDRFFGGPQLQGHIHKLKQKHPHLTMPKYCAESCAHAESLAGITMDGRLFPCAGDFEPAPIAELSFDGIFNHPYLLGLRSLHRAGKIISPCRICMTCQA